jgi:hypothetical protein
LVKISAILIFVIHLYSSVCYSFVFNYLIHLSDKQTAAQLDKNLYNDAALIEITVPLNMPYMSNQNNYERCDGSIELKGVQYNYVKRKISNDTLHILCIPNEQKTQLHEAKNNYTKQLTDLPSGNKKENNSQAKKVGFFSEYNNQITQYCFTAITRAVTQNTSSFKYFIPKGYVDPQIKPPKAVA